MISLIQNVMKFPVVTISPEDSVFQATQVMKGHKIGCLPVTENGKIVGIVTSRDVRSANSNRIIADAMTVNPITITADNSIWSAYNLMDRVEIEHLPVLSGENIVGIVAKSDLLFEMGKHIDPLTGLHNSSYIRFIGEALLNEGKEVTVLFFDLNNFGQFNKTYGHIVGDKCLKILSQILASNILEEQDFLGRFGGDEFLIISLRKSEEIMVWVKNLVRIVEQTFYHQSLPIKVAVGLAGGRRNVRRDAHMASTLDNLINLASLNSTRAKREGRTILMSN